MGTWALYTREWVSVYGTPQPGPAGRAACQEDFTNRFRGKIVDGDWKIEQPDGAGWTFLLLAIPVLRGEFATKELAEHQAGDNQGKPHRIIPRDGPEEAALRDYGRRKFPVR